MLGVFLSLVLIIIVFIGILATAISGLSNEKIVHTDPNTILEVTFNTPIRERAPSNPLANIDFNSMKTRNTLGLDDILKNIKKAAADPDIKGIYLHVPSLQAGYATVEEIRNVLLDFKKSGKFIISYAESYSQGAYYLASVADKIYLNPEGNLDFKGIHAELMFFKGALEKLEIEPQVIRHGKFKSAIEPYINDKMSDENRTQLAGLLDDLWDHLLVNIAGSRKMEKDTLQEIAGTFSAREATDALRLKLVDGLKYEDEVMDELRKKSGLNPDDKVKTLTLNKYNHVPEAAGKGYAKDKIAIIYAAGVIESGQGDDETIGSDNFAETISKARKDNSIKAIVLRVNSPGGSALASDVIWREVMLAKKTKPVIVSMGDVAASGGYYISCAADSIVAEANTITGSIGVFGLLFNAQKLMNHTLGITTDTYKTGVYADIGTISRPLTVAERNIMQLSVEKVYNTFTGRVAAGRKISQANVDSMGQGRVWSGTDALNLGLIDRIGGIDEAIKIAARMARVNEYRITSLPAKKAPLEELMSNLKEDAATSFAKQELGETYSYYRNMQSMLKLKGIQALLPFYIVTDY